MADRVFEQVLAQLAGAQQSLNQVPFAAEERRLRADDIARDEARFQQGREDNLTDQARSMLLRDVDQITEALGQLDPNNAEDRPIIERLNRALQQRQQSLGLTGQAALDAFAQGTVPVAGQPVTTFGAPATINANTARGLFSGAPGRNISMTPSATVTPDVETPVGQVIASGRAQARTATERREDKRTTEAFNREIFLREMGFTQENLSREDMQAFQAAQAEIDRRFQRGESAKQITAALYQQMRQLDFQGSQGDLERAVQRYGIDSQASLEGRRLDIQASAAGRDSFIASIQKFDPDNPRDRELMDMVVADAEASGSLLPSDLAQVRAAAAAQSGEAARLMFSEGRSRIAQLDATTAATNMQAQYTEYQINSGKAADLRASASEAMTFVEQSVNRGAVGAATLRAMLGALESGNVEGSQYEGFLQHLDVDTLREAVVKATELGEDADLQRSVRQAEAGNALMEQRGFSLDIIASQYSPEEMQRIAGMTDEEIGGDVALRMVRDALRDKGGLSRAANLAAVRERQEELQAEAPRIGWAQSQLQYYATQRPDSIEQGENAVRSALEVMAKVGLFGDPDDPDGQREEIERVVSFYRQAWGDQGEMFDANLANLASQAALNRANAARARADAEADGGLSLDRLKYQKDLIDANIDAVKEKATQMGCSITAQGIVTGGGFCQVAAREIAGYQLEYGNLLALSGYRTVTELEYLDTVEQLTRDVQRDMPNATTEEINAEVGRRLQGVMTGSTEEPAPTPPPAPPAAPRTPEEQGANFVQGVGQFGRDVGGAATGVAGAVGQGIGAVNSFLEGMFGTSNMGQQVEDMWNNPPNPSGGR